MFMTWSSSLVCARHLVLDKYVKEIKNGEMGNWIIHLMTVNIKETLLNSAEKKKSSLKYSERQYTSSDCNKQTSKMLFYFSTWTVIMSF